MEKNEIQQLIKAMKEVFPTAEIVASGFEATAKKTDVDERFEKIEKQLTRIEKTILTDQGRRITGLEEEVKAIKETIGMIK